MSDQPIPSPSPAAYLDELHRALSGNRVPGGCDDCDAYQTLTKQADGFYVLVIRHDESCPYYREAIRSPLRPHREENPHD